MIVRRRIAFSILCASAWLLPSLASAQRVTDEKLVNPDLVSPFARVAESVMPSVASIRTVSAFDHPEVGGDFDRFFRGQGDMDRPGASSHTVVKLCSRINLRVSL